ncbi:hypothetical protein T439DRAFT_152388 [Meredithblackwellia eburnea MCA 4105]
MSSFYGLYPSPPSTNSPSTASPNSTDGDILVFPPELDLAHDLLSPPSSVLSHLQPRTEEKNLEKREHKIVKPRRKRKGCVIDALRNDQAVVKKDTTSQPLEVATRPVKRPNLSHFTAASRLNAFEDLGALTAHLIALATGEVMTFSSPPKVNLSRMNNEVRKKLGVSLRHMDPYQEIILACLAALGSRRTSHSSITGVLNVSPAVSSPPSAFSPLEIGFSRESACQALAQRAADLATRAKLLEDHSRRAIEVVDLLRVTMFTVAPRNPFALDLVQYGLEHLSCEEYRDQCSPTGKMDAEKAHLAATAFISYDAFTAILLDTEPVVTSKQAYEIGWNTSKTSCLVTDMDVYPELRGGHPASTPPPKPLRTSTKPIELIEVDLGFGTNLGSGIDRMVKIKAHGNNLSGILLRHVATLQHETLHNPTSPSLSNLPQTVNYLWRLSSIYTIIMQNLAVSAPHHLVPMTPSSRAHFAALPTVIEGAIVRVLTKASSSGNMALKEDCEALLDEGKRRYLKTLKVFLRSLDMLSTSPADTHVRGLLLDALDLLPGWTEVVVNAAVQDENQTGSLAVVGFGWDWVGQILKHLRLTGTAFPSTRRREADLLHALASLDVPVYNDWVGNRGTMELEATALVHQALDAISQ